MGLARLLSDRPRLPWWSLGRKDCYNEPMNPIFNLSEQELARQRSSLNLIASENYPSPKVLQLLGSVWQNRYSEGYPHKRYYAGQEYVDKLEELVVQKALAVFDSTGEYGVNVQLLSGTPANTAVYLTALEPGDTVLSLRLANGGHLSHLHSTSAYNQFYKHASYDVVESESSVFEIDYDDFARQLKAHHPKLTIIGFSAYPRAYEFAKLCELAHQAGSLVLADIAHIAGLVAVNRHDSPFRKGKSGADFVSMTTHKSLRGPRSALVFAKKEHMEALNKTVFPGSSGGPHLHSIASVGQALLEALGEDTYPDDRPFDHYIDQVMSNVKALETGLSTSGLTIVAPSQTHLCLVRLPAQIDSLEVQNRLEAIGIITNRNMIFNDPKPAWRPSGLRLGTLALTSRGMDEVMAQSLGRLIGRVVSAELDQTQGQKEVAELVHQLKWYY